MSFLYSIIIFLTSNFYIFKTQFDIKVLLLVFIPAFIIINLFPTFGMKKLKAKKLENIRKGYILLEIFLMSCIMSIIYFFLQLFFWKTSFKVLGWNILFIVIQEFIVFWNGMIRLYIYSNQLGIKYRVIGAICGMIPILNIIVLVKMISIAKKEVQFENDKYILNEQRKEKQVCKTKYPILLVHGVFFRDYKFLNYWGRIPEELIKNGATCYYGNHSSAVSIEDSGKEITDRIKEIIQETGCEKVNIIAHSKGGLDCRYAISECNIEDNIASLTMINTPNRGCEFADYLLSKVPEKIVKSIANKYNYTLKRLGDSNPDFIKATKDLTSSSCNELNKKLRKSNKVYYQSFGSKLIKSNSARFPLNMTTGFVKKFDGDNDGLVGEKSFEYGDKYLFLTPTGKRGISHGDMIDLNRENIEGFDVREFYVNLVSELREMGF